MTFQKAKTYLAPIAEFYTYCLMPNHFHFLLRFKSEKELQENLAGFQNLQGLDKLPAQILSNFLNGYAKAYNKIYNRKGSLFMRNAGRVKVQTDEYLKELIKYIHLNPVNANLVSKPQDWKYSSYSSLTSGKPTLLNRDYILDLFDGIEDFEFHHRT